MKNSTHYRLRALACAMLASATMLGACDDDDPDDDPGKKPPVKLTDQLQYDGGDLVGIKSAIYVVEEDGSHTFYLSPTEGLINAEQMEQADDYLRVKVDNPEGSVNTAADPFEIEYKDISVKKTTMNDVASVELSVDLVTETRLNLYTCVELKSGKTLLARYQNTCTEERDVELTNQYEIDNRIAAVGSVVEWRNVREGNRRFCLYEQEGLTAPEEGAAGVEILLAEELFGTAEIDLATADPAKVRIRCGEFTTGAGTTGTLTAKYLTDKFGTIEGLVVALDASKDGKRLRAAYEGTFAGGYAATNTIKVTEPASGGEAAAAAEAPIAALFSQEPQVGSYVFALGDAETAAAPADLAKGHWAAYVRVLAAKFDGVIDVAAQTSDYWFRLYDHKTYQTYYGEDAGLTGTIETRPNPAGGKEIYLRVSLTLKNGIGVEAEYYGVPTAATADAMDEDKLKPVKPFEPSIQIRTKDNKEPEGWTDKTLDRMEVRLEKGYRWNGGEEYGGATFDAYFFYFCTGAEGSSVEDKWANPQLILPAAIVDAGKECDLTDFDNTKSHWNFYYDTSMDYLARGSIGYGDTYTQWGMTTKLCPDMAKVTAIRNADKTWQVSLFILDYGAFDSWRDDKSGTENTLTIEFRGKAAKYSGSKTNDLADDFYE